MLFNKVAYYLNNDSEILYQLIESSFVIDSLFYYHIFEYNLSKKFKIES